MIKNPRSAKGPTTEESTVPVLKDQFRSMQSRRNDVDEYGHPRPGAIEGDNHQHFEEIRVELLAIKEEQLRLQSLYGEMRAEQRMMRDEYQRSFAENQKVLLNLVQMVHSLSRGKEPIGPESSGGILPTPKEYGESHDLTLARTHGSKGHGVIEWDKFVRALNVRYADNVMEDVVELFNSLRQEGGVEEYRIKFEELKPHMERLFPQLTEPYYISSFIGGLKSEIKPMVRLLKPSNLYQAIEQAKLQEILLQATAKAMNFSYAGAKASDLHSTGSTQKVNIETHPLNTINNQAHFQGQASPQLENNAYSLTSSPKRSVHPNHKRTFAENIGVETQPKRTLGSCYECGDRTYLGHHCQTRRLMTPQEGPGEVAVEEVCGEVEMDVSKLENCGDGSKVRGRVKLSMNVIGGGVSDNSIKFKGQMKGRAIMILIVSGSTDSFVDSKTARDLGLETKQVSPVSVAFADGRKLVVKTKCLGCTWLMRGYKFQFDVRVMDLGGGFDMILGVDWMETCSPITFNFKQNRLVINKDGKMIELWGMKEKSIIELLRSKGLQNSEWNGMAMRLFSITVEELPLPQ